MTKTMLISGGSRGIGQATALLAARKGWQVMLTFQSDHKAAQQTLEAISKQGGKARSVQMDTKVEADVLKAFDATQEAFAGLDAVVVNAGIVAPSMPLSAMTAERMKNVFDTNVFGAFLFAREAARRLPELMQDGHGAMVIVSSMAARLGSPNEYVDYAASKGAMDTFVTGLSKELSPSGIRVNGVRPGLIETDIHASGGQPDRAQRLGRSTPMGRPGTADEVAQAIIWLCSSEASYCTGTFIDIAGGR